MTTYRFKPEGGFFSDSATPVEEPLELTVEVDDYIKVEDMNITFD